MSAKPRRISITLPQSTAHALEQRSLREGRSLSNLAAHLLERALTAHAGLPPAQEPTVPQRSPQPQPSHHG